VRSFFKYLARTNQVLSNPASDIEMPKVPQRLPPAVLNVSEVERILAVPDLEDTIGLRDRAILETLYSTGIRRRELCRLAVYDLDIERGTLLIREGKWKKDRFVPIGERALAWVEKASLRRAGVSWSSRIPRRSSWARSASRSTPAGSRPVSASR
jgi:integrase/recombinase XerD